MKEKKDQKILIVDDEKKFVELLAETIRKMGYHSVVTAYNGKEALEFIEKEDFDLMLLDIKMPVMSGVQVLLELQKMKIWLPTIIITAYNVKEMEKVFQEFRIVDYFSKPIDLIKLKKILELILENPELDNYSARIRLQRIVDNQTKTISTLRNNIDQLSPKKIDGNIEKEIDKYRQICAAAAHNLKGEFLHIGYSNKEIREISSASKEIGEECDIIQRSVAYSQIILQRLLDHLDMGKPKMGPIDSLKLLKEVEILVRPRLQSNITLKINTDPKLKNKAIFANFEQVMGVLIELIKNAETAMAEKGGLIEIYLTSKNRKIIITVRDDGPGIPHKLKSQLLKKKVESEVGLGLGIYLCNKVVQGFGGKLKLVPPFGKGAAFELSFPTIDDQEEQNDADTNSRRR